MLAPSNDQASCVSVDFILCLSVFFKIELIGEFLKSLVTEKMIYSCLLRNFLWTLYF